MTQLIHWHNQSGKPFYHWHEGGGRKHLHGKMWAEAEGKTLNISGYWKHMPKSIARYMGKDQVKEIESGMYKQSGEHENPLQPPRKWGSEGWAPTCPGCRGIVHSDMPYCIEESKYRLKQDFPSINVRFRYWDYGCLRHAFAKDFLTSVRKHTDYYRRQEYWDEEAYKAADDRIKKFYICFNEEKIRK